QGSLGARGARIRRRSCPAPPVYKAESPPFDQMPAGEPLIGPRKNESSGDPGGERGAHLPAENPGLFRIAIAHRIDAELGQHQRLVDSEIMQTGDVAAERRFIVQVDVETKEISEIDRQIFG